VQILPIHLFLRRTPVIGEMLGAFPQLELYPLPSYSPQLQMIERFWKVLRWRASPNRLFRPMAQPTQAFRHSLC